MVEHRQHQLLQLADSGEISQAATKTDVPRKNYDDQTRCVYIVLFAQFDVVLEDLDVFLHYRIVEFVDDAGAIDIHSNLLHTGDPL